MEYFANPTIARLLDGCDAFIFDMNGLLIDDEPLQLAAYNEVLAPHRLSIAAEYWTSHCLGRKARQFMAEYLLSNRVSADLFAKLLPLKEAAYDRLLAAAGKSVVRPGVRDLLHHLRHHRQPTALATSAARRTADGILKLVGISPEWFDACVFGDDVTHGKPHPEIFEKVRAALPGCKQFVVFEDAPPGIAAAKAAGMRCIAVPNSLTRNCDLSQADLVITDLTRDAAPREPAVNAA